MCAQAYEKTLAGRYMSTEMVSARRVNELMLLSTLMLLLSYLIAAISAMHAQDADMTFRLAAPFIGTGLLFAIWIEGHRALRNLVRVDILMLLALYLLTFIEFLFPQPSINDRVSPEAAQTAVRATLLGFAGITLGRHLFPARHGVAKRLQIAASPRMVVTLLIVCAILGYLHMLIAVRFDIFEMLHQMTRPRFSQPWTRGRLGGFSTLLNEFGLLKFLIPPLTAAIFLQRKNYRYWQLLVAVALLGLVFFESFAAGTRFIFVSHLATFVAAYALLLPRLTLAKLTVVVIPLVAIGVFATVFLPEIRTVGLSEFSLESARTQTLFIDLNLVNLANLTEVFPSRVPFLGLEIPYIAAIRPIPRALWPDKPAGLSVGLEDALGVGNHMTISASFIGEMWLAGGYIGIALGAICYGAAAGAWNRRGAQATTTLQMIVFAVGFFPAGLGMRSFLSIVPAMLPAIAMIVALRVLGRRRKRRHGIDRE